MTVTLALTANGLVRVEPASFLGGQAHAEFEAACRRGGFYFLARPVPAHYGSPDNLLALVKSLKNSGFSPTAAPELVRHLTERTNRLNQWKVDMAARAKGLAARDLRMKPYQVHDAHVVAQRQAILIAHEMRVGKSIVTLAAAPDNAALVIICPKTAKLEWIRTIRQWRPDIEPVPIDKSTSFRWPVPGEAVVVHYDALPAAPVRTSHETICIIDEVHRCKNTKTIVYKKTKALVRTAMLSKGKCWLTTGTPIMNKQPELWAILQLAGLGSEAFGSWPTFCRVMGGLQGIWGMEWGEPTPKGKELLKKVMIRRTREEVGMGSMPSYEEIAVPVKGLVEEELNEFERVLSHHGLTLSEVVNLTAGAAAARHIDFTMIARVRSAVAGAKIPAMMRIVQQHERNKEPLVIFSSHRAPVNHLRDRPGWGVVTGEDSTKHREETIAAFKRGELLGVGLTIKACGVALDLTRSSRALFVDRDWVPANNAQAESRLAGHDQKNPVTIATLVADHPIEHRLYEILLTKQGISDDVLGK